MEHKRLITYYKDELLKEIKLYKDLGWKTVGKMQGSDCLYFQDMKRSILRR